MNIAASFAPASGAGNPVQLGEQSKGFNLGLGFYFLVWGILSCIFTIAAMRT
jgi:uncharacterized protein